MTVNNALCNSWHSSVVARIILSIICLWSGVRIKSRAFSLLQKKIFSGISEATVSLMVSHIIWPGICVLPSQTTMRACTRVVVIETTGSFRDQLGGLMAIGHCHSLTTLVLHVFFFQDKGKGRLMFTQFITLTC